MEQTSLSLVSRTPREFPAVLKQAVPETPRQSAPVPSEAADGVIPGALGLHKLSEGARGPWPKDHGEDLKSRFRIRDEGKRNVDSLLRWHPVTAHVSADSVLNSAARS